MAEEKQIKAVIQGQFNEILPGYGNIANFLYEDNKNDKIGNQSKEQDDKNSEGKYASDVSEFELSEEDEPSDDSKQVEKKVKTRQQKSQDEQKVENNLMIKDYNVQDLANQVNPLQLEQQQQHEQARIKNHQLSKKQGQQFRKKLYGKNKRQFNKFLKKQKIYIIEKVKKGSLKTVKIQNQESKNSITNSQENYPKLILVSKYGIPLDKMEIEGDHEEKNQDEAKQIPKEDLTLEEQFRKDNPDQSKFHIKVIDIRNKIFSFSDLILPFSKKVQNIYKRYFDEKITNINIKQVYNVLYEKVKTNREELLSNADNALFRIEEFIPDYDLMDHKEQKHQETIELEDKSLDKRKLTIIQPKNMQTYKWRNNSTHRMNIINSGYFYEQLKQIAFNNLERKQVAKLSPTQNIHQFTKNTSMESNNSSLEHFVSKNQGDQSGVQESPSTFSFGQPSFRQADFFEFSSSRKQSFEQGYTPILEHSQPKKRQHGSIFEEKANKEEELIIDFSQNFRKNQEIKLWGCSKVKLKDALRKKQRNFYKEVHKNVFKFEEEKFQEEKENSNFLYYNQDVISGN